MQVARAQQPIAAAAVTLVLWILGVASFLPPLVKYTTHSVLLMIVAGLGIAVCLVLHLVFIGIAAKRLGRSPALWVIISLCFMPVASIIGLILFEWFSEQEKQATA
jgi:F0F1-type ATP synthase membrane subunit a